VVTGAAVVTTRLVVAGGAVVTTRVLLDLVVVGLVLTRAFWVVGAILAAEDTELEETAVVWEVCTVVVGATVDDVTWGATEVEVAAAEVLTAEVWAGTEETLEV
jgi:hypothetical protein